ncbi:MAG: AraC family transcriptional regulator, partial [Oscillospiraceae bacterium]
LIVFTTSYLKELSGQNDNQGDRIEEIVEYIHQNIQKNITRKDLADAVYLNPEYLSRLFKKEKGCTLSEFILKEKMNIAKSLLETTGFSVSIIASKVGYSNFSHFAQCFKKGFGVSPSEFRQKAK